MKKIIKLRQEKMQGGSNTFLFEIIIVILFFSLCVAIVMQLFVSAYLKTQLDKNISEALLITQTKAESFKAIKKPDEIKVVFNNAFKTSDGFQQIFAYDKNWNLVSDRYLETNYVDTSTDLRFFIFVDITAEPKPTGKMLKANIQAIEINEKKQTELANLSVKNFIAQ